MINDKDNQVKIKQLILQLRSSDIAVAKEAAKNLVFLREPNATKALIKELASSEIDLWVVDAAAWAFYEVHDHTIVEPLIHIIEKRGYSYPAVKALQELGDSRAVLPLYQLLQKSEVPGIATSLGRMGCSEAVILLVQMVKHPNPEIRYYVVRALGLLQDERALPILEEVQTNDTAFFSSPKGLQGKNVSEAATKAINMINAKNDSE